MPERIVLMFAYHFPPENSIGGVRPYRFYKYLSRMGYRCHVITAVDQASQPSSDVEYVPDPFVTRPRQDAGWQIERAVRKLLFPGATGIRWSSLACRAARNFLGANSDAEITIFSTYPPVGTHLAALRLTSGNDLKWIADFRDPLGDNPSHTFLKGYQRVVHRWLERMVARTATIVIANTDAMAEAWKTIYQKRRDSIHLIWNGFDPEDRLRPLQLPERKYRLISHVGSLYQGRIVTPLLESFSRLIESGRLAADRVRIRLIGAMLSESIPRPEFLQRAKASGWLELIPEPIPHADACKITQTSDGLLLVQPHSSVQVPGKLYEYLQIGRPVLAYVPFHTPIERILERSGVPYQCVYAGSPPQEMDDAVESFLSLAMEARPASDWFELHFDARNQTQILEKLIRSIHGRQSE